MEYVIIIISAIFVNNIVFSQFLGICPFLGVSTKTETALGMSAAVIFVMTLATLVTYLINYFILVPLQLDKFLQTISYILVIAALVQMVEIILKKVSPALYQALGIYLPLITTNCAVLGVTIIVVKKSYDLGESIVYTVGISIGFALALVIFSGIREHLDLMGMPKGMRGIPIALIVAGILALAFMGFTGLV
jgi:electron transport complex protein RnfA